MRFVNVKMPRIIFNCVMLLLWGITFMTLAYAQEEILETTVKDGENEIHLKWKKTKQLLANEHLPVWIASLCPRDSSVKHELKSTLVKDEIGEFVMYHDVEQSSAVVYFKKLNILHGTIDIRYTIDGLPFTELNQVHMVDGPYVKRLENNEDHTKLLNPSIPQDQIDCGPSTSSQDEPPPKKRPRTHCTTSQVPTLYPEILVFVAYDKTQSAKTKDPNNYLATIVKEYIIYFNGVDMLFAKLSAHDINIHFNIAGIVIDENNIFPMVKSNFPPLSNALQSHTHSVDAVKTLDVMKTYIKKDAKLFVEDSFDFFFISTDSILQEDNLRLRGRAMEGNHYIARLSETTYDYLLGAMSQYGLQGDYVVAAHEISHLMSVTHVPRDESFNYYYMQCHSIMKDGGEFCQNCLKWSDQNIEELKIYATKNRNHCYLLNTPRSLHPYGIPIRSLSPSTQCLCYGFQPRRKTSLVGLRDLVAASNCNKKLICENIGPYGSTPIPLDGTPCGEAKVCWKRKCQKIPNAE